MLPQPKVMRRLVGASVALHLVSKQSIAGTLTGVFADAVTMRGARLLVEGSGAHGVDGEVVVPKEKIAWIQVGIQIDDARLAS